MIRKLGGAVKRSAVEAPAPSAPAVEAPAPVASAVAAPASAALDHYRKRGRDRAKDDEDEYESYRSLKCRARFKGRWRDVVKFDAVVHVRDGESGMKLLELNHVDHLHRTDESDTDESDIDRLLMLEMVYRVVDVTCVVVGDAWRIVTICNVTITVWDGESGTALLTLQHADDAECEAKAERLRSTLRGLEVRALMTRLLTGWVSIVECISLGDVWRIVSVSVANTSSVNGSMPPDCLRVWNGENGAALLTLEHGGKVSGVSCIDMGNGWRIVSGSDDKTVRVWDGGSGAALLTLEHAGEVNAVACIVVCNGWRIVSGSDDVRVWDGESGAQLACYELMGKVSSIALATRDDEVTVCANGCAYLRMAARTALLHRAPHA